MATTEEGRETDSGIEIKPVYTDEDVAELELELPGEFPFTRGPYKDMYRGPAVDDPAVRGLRLGRGDERPLPLSARARADRAVCRVRSADPARLRLRRPARGRRGGADRRRNRLAGRHGAPLRRDPARRGLDVDDDQRAGRRCSCSCTSSSPRGRASPATSCAAPSRTTSSRSTAPAGTTSSRRGPRCG